MCSVAGGGRASRVRAAADGRARRWGRTRSWPSCASACDVGSRAPGRMGRDVRNLWAAPRHHPTAVSAQRVSLGLRSCRRADPPGTPGLGRVARIWVGRAAGVRPVPRPAHTPATGRRTFKTRSGDTRWRRRDGSHRSGGDVQGVVTDRQVGVPASSASVTRSRRVWGVARRAGCAGRRGGRAVVRSGRLAGLR
jgi:hypothetical protein